MSDITEDTRLFRYRGLSTLELDEMIYAHQREMTEGVVTENARLRQSIQMIYDNLMQGKPEVSASLCRKILSGQHQEEYGKCT
jgi:hypothetical protein